MVSRVKSSNGAHDSVRLTSSERSQLVTLEKVLGTFEERPLDVTNDVLVPFTSLIGAEHVVYYDWCGTKETLLSIDFVHVSSLDESKFRDAMNDWGESIAPTVPYFFPTPATRRAEYGAGVGGARLGESSSCSFTLHREDDRSAASDSFDLM